MQTARLPGWGSDPDLRSKGEDGRIGLVSAIFITLHNTHYAYYAAQRGLTTNRPRRIPPTGHEARPDIAELKRIGAFRNGAMAQQVSHPCVA